MTDRRTLSLRLLIAVGLTSLVVVMTVVATYVTRDGPPSPPAPDAPDAADWDTLVDLDGEWAFRIGDDPAWAAAEVPDAGWGRIAAPGTWEDGGYHGYDGFAWYRRAFELTPEALERARRGPATLHLGRIDDSDEVWVNGLFVGKGGRMPRDQYATGLFVRRAYTLPPDVLRAGRNTVAVRVYDGGLEGGFTSGPLALSVPTPQNPATVQPDVDLAGWWRLRLGDDARYAEPGLDLATWDSLRVPGTFEAQGRSYDGLAWLRTEVELTEAAAADEMLLVLGAVDDLDQAFVNGVMVGATGNLETRAVSGDEYLRERVYRVPAGLLRPGRNAVAVRVYDGLFDGGITAGPVGLMRPKTLAERDALREAAERGDDS